MEEKEKAKMMGKKKEIDRAELRDNLDSGIMASVIGKNFEPQSHPSQPKRIIQSDPSRLRVNELI